MTGTETGPAADEGVHPGGGSPGSEAPDGGPAPSGGGRGKVLALLGVGAVAVIAVVAAVVLVSGGDDSPYPDEWDERVAPIAEWVADERELEFEHPVEVLFLSEQEYRDEATSGEEGEAEDEQQEAEETVELLRALGLISGEVDLEAAGDDLSGEGSLAFYDDRDETVYVKGSELTPAVQVTVAHELTHVLQDQHFDLSRLRDGEEDLQLGLRAVAEGDADRIEAAYAEGELSDEEQEEYESESSDGQDSAEEGLAEVPPVLVALFTAPYALGQGFIGSLDGEAEKIDDALRDPPTEQELLDPLSRGTDRAEVVEVEAPEAPDGAEVVDEDTFGALALYLVLAARSDPTDALAAIDGWGGDAFVSYRQDDRVCVDIVVAGDDADATEVLRTALDGWVEQDPSGTATVEAAGDALRLRSCDPGADAEVPGEVGEEVVALPAIRAQIEEQLQGDLSLSAEQARCATDAIFGELSIDEITAAELPPETIERVQALAESCR